MATEPTERVDLDLDALDREGVPDAPASKPPFSFLLSGRRYVLPDLRDMDWREAIRAQADPTFMFQKMISDPDDWRVFVEAKIPGWKLNEMFRRYRQHYGLPEPGE